MTDRELLEKAAKAAGYALAKCADDRRDRLWNFKTMNWWDPLADDGDALRLAVDLRIDLSLWINTASVTAKTHIGAGRGISLTGNNDRPQNDHLEPFGDDPYAATRRAIVRAAAAIGSYQ